MKRFALIHKIAMLAMLLPALSCKKEAETQNGSVSNGVQFQFNGRAGTSFVSLYAGINSVSVAPVTSVNDRLLVLGIADDEELFKAGSRFAPASSSAAFWRFSVFFALPSAAQITPGVYPLAVYDDTATGTYSMGRAAIKLVNTDTGFNSYTSYHPLNSGATGSVTVTAVEDYSENGRSYKKVSFSVSATVYKRTTTLPVPESLLVTGSGVALF
jgi:hypothetical protein